jgi:hypothetical protein
MLSNGERTLSPTCIKHVAVRIVVGFAIYLGMALQDTLVRIFSLLLFMREELYKSTLLAKYTQNDQMKEDEMGRHVARMGSIGMHIEICREARRKGTTRQTKK